MLTIADDLLLVLRPHAAPVAIAPAGWAERMRAARLVYKPDVAMCIASGGLKSADAVRLGRQYGLLVGAA